MGAISHLSTPRSFATGGEGRVAWLLWRSMRTHERGVTYVTGRDNRRLF